LEACRIADILRTNFRHLNFLRNIAKIIPRLKYNDKKNFNLDRNRRTNLLFRFDHWTILHYNYIFPYIQQLKERLTLTEPLFFQQLRTRIQVP
jgi:hypothetical protein